MNNRIHGRIYLVRSLTASLLEKTKPARVVSGIIGKKRGKNSYEIQCYWNSNVLLL